MAKDWIGNKNSTFKTLGASNHTEKEREDNDYYATDPIAAKLLCSVEKFSSTVWECACGEGHLSKELENQGYKVISSDLIDRGFGTPNIDFLACSKDFNGDIITNPPYKFAQEFIEKGLSLISNGHKVAMFLKVQFLEGKKRKELFEKYPPKTIYVSSSRIMCAKNADFDGMHKGGGSAVAYAWYVWEKGYSGDTILKWIN